MIRRLALASALVLITASAAAAQGGRPSPDTNGDGFVSKAEHIAASEAGFKRLDANGDGVIDAAEQAKLAQMMGGNNILAPADLNKDGKITRAEFTTASNYRFVQADVNKDDRLDAKEQESLRMAHRPK